MGTSFHRCSDSSHAGVTTASRPFIRPWDAVVYLTMAAYAVVFLTMPERKFLRLLARIENCGVWVAMLDGLVMTALAISICVALRNERKLTVWLGGIGFGIVALAANLLDYLTTLHFSPDLALENNPVWNSVIHTFGLDLAIAFGLVGKLFLSLFAGLCFAYYLSNRNILLPESPQSFRTIAFHVGKQNKTPKQRMLCLATVLAFYFAAINLFCFYVAYANSLVKNLPALNQLPSLTAVIVFSLILITCAFFFDLHRAQKR